MPTVGVADASFSLDEGEFASLVGQSGSGKSTLLNLIGLLDTPTSGRVAIKGEGSAVLGKRGRARARNLMIGFVFQFHYLLPEFSMLENILMPARIAGHGDDKRTLDFAHEVTDLLGISGLERKRADEMSGGQKQRAAVARALINRPALVLADEPTGNLDSANSEQVYDLFRRVNREFGTAFMIVTHDLRVAKWTDRIFEIVDGRLTEGIGGEVDAESA